MTILYHFCAPQFLDGILLEGITHGATPILHANGQIGFIASQQWLTENSDFQQSWNTMNMVKYDRTAFRLSVEIPTIFKRHLIRFIPDYRKMIAKVMLPNFDSHPDCKNWWVYNGRINRRWIVDITEKK